MSDTRAQATHFAQAIMQATVERWQGTLKQAAEVLSEDTALAAQMASGGNVDTQVASLIQAMGANLSDTETNLLKTVVQSGNTQMLGEIASALAEVASGQSGPEKAEITSAIELSAEEQDALRQKLSAEYGSNLVFSFHVDNSLMGGLRVRVGDRLTDNSVASRLTALRESMASVAR
ncbi:MAG: ATP synthase F1 subunit delta [Chloroflexota bacterium]